MSSKIIMPAMSNIKAAFSKLWNDPVWSKVISGLILLLIVSIPTYLLNLWPLIKVFYNNFFTLATEKTSIPNWFLALLCLLSLYFIISITLLKYLFSPKLLFTWWPFRPLEHQFHKGYKDIEKFLTACRFGDRVSNEMRHGLTSYIVYNEVESNVENYIHEILNQEEKLEAAIISNNYAEQIRLRDWFGKELNNLDDKFCN